MRREVTVVGGGLSGLVAAICCAERDATVTLHEARSALGGRARTADAPFRANLGPHVLYADGRSWAWLGERGLRPPARRAPVIGGIRVVHERRARRVPPATLLRAWRLRGCDAPVERDFRGWAAERCGDEAADLLVRAAGVLTFDHDPGRLSAPFVLERGRRVLALPPSARYVAGGWGALVEVLARRARELGVRVVLGSRVEVLPEAPVIVAVGPADAAGLLGEGGWPGLETTRCVTLDLGVRRRRGDPFLVPDLDGCGWLERFSAADRTLAPPGHDLVQGHAGLRPGEGADAGAARLERAADAAFPRWRERQVWRRRQVMDAGTGALDLPGSTWRDRPAVDRGDGVLLAGDWVAAPGFLSEVAFASAEHAAALAVGAAGRGSAAPVT